MEGVRKSGIKVFIAFAIMLGFTNSFAESSCSTKLFTVTIDNKLTIGDVIDNLADTCGLSVIVKDEATKLRMNKRVYYVKLKNTTLKGFLNTVLKDNDLNFSLKGNKLSISYLLTRTFRIHYISGQRTGKSTANVTIANSSNSGNTDNSTNTNDGDTSKTGIEITNTDDFQFWKTVESEVQRILMGASDEGHHYTKVGDTWTGPDGRIWEYNPLAPIVNPEAGMVTVTGTHRQIKRVSNYIYTLTKQIKSQVLIDIRIMSVLFDDSTTTGVDWSQLYTLQNMAVSTLVMSQKNIAGYAFDNANGITDITLEQGAKPSSAKVINLAGNVNVSEVVKFLNTQGDVKTISSPRVMTLNNQPALISVGQEIFYKIKSSSTASSGGGAVAAEGELIDSVFAGILLDITPEIGGNGMITLKINPSISDTVDSVTPADGVRTIPPDLRRRQIASVIKVRDGEHVILGGLISSQTGYKDNSVPFFGDLPGIGSMFKRSEKVNKVEELVFIISPHIVRNGKSVSLKDLGYTKLSGEDYNDN